MFRNLTRYGAITAKTRAMYGRMLRPADWEALSGMQDLADVAGFIRSHDGWREAGEMIPQGCRDSRLIEKAMHFQLESEYERIYKFATREDKRFFLFAVYRTEYRRILSALRRVITGRVTEPDELPTGFMAEKTGLLEPELSQAGSFEDIITAAENTIYSNILKTVPVSGTDGKPDYAAAHILLENRFYSAIWRYLQKDYSGQAKDWLREACGREADFLNLTHIMRLHRNFPGSLANLDELLIPVRWKLTDRFIEKLAAAPTEEAALSLLRASRWGNLFAENRSGAAEHSYETGLEAFCRRSIHAPEPSVIVPQAYLTLKGVEYDKLTRAVEAARYGISPGEVI